MNALPPGLHGAFRIAALRRELGRYRVEALLRDGRLVPYSRHVVIARERQLDLWTRAAATLLLAGPRAVLTGYTAAYLHGCTAADTGCVHVLVDYHRKLSNLPGVLVHQGLFDEQDVLDLSGREVYRLDFAWEEPRVALEYDGYAAHVDRAGRDAARDEDLRRRGWSVLRATADDLKDPSRLHVEIRRAFWRRRFAA